MEEGRWTAVTPSAHQHEREALEYVRLRLPDHEPYRAWSNFTFTAGGGHVREVDLLVAAPGGLFLIEIKSLRGRLTAQGSNWVQHRPSRSKRYFENPLHLANAKARELRSLLSGTASGRQVYGAIPFVQAAVFLAAPDLVVELLGHQLHGVYGPEGHRSLPEIGADLLRKPPVEARYRVTPEFSKKLGDLLHDVGIARSRRRLQVGSWMLEAPPFDVGRTWQDHHATHERFPTWHRRIRIYLMERNASQEIRASIDRAARREVASLQGINHPGIVRVEGMEPHESGPALIFEHDRRAKRLDHYMLDYHGKIGLDARLNVIRQIAEALAYAHRRRLYHRALSARSVLVMPGRSPKGNEAEAWLLPQIQLIDWQVASRSLGTLDLGAAHQPSTTSHLERNLASADDVYLAPEVTTRAPDPVSLDVFGLGALSYVILTGLPPAETRMDLMARLQEKEEGLSPSAVEDSISDFLNELIQAATAPAPSRRLSSIADFLELLEGVEDKLTAPEEVEEPDQEAVPDIDPLEAHKGDVVGGEWRIEKRLGTGSTSRAFLATHLATGREEVLKVALSSEKESRLEHEAAVLRNLRNDNRVIALARPEPVRIGGRAVIVLEHVGSETVARKLRETGRLTVDELDRYGDYLFGAVDFLEGEGVTHRDIKCDNIAIRARPNRSRQLVLFDFSLAGTSVQQIEAGTAGYLDPFLGVDPSRLTYDAHAERYAVAVTLHEMASGELPVWGDGGTEPRFTKGPPRLATEAFDPAVRDGLTEFFHRALHRDARQRFGSLRDMHRAWHRVFQLSDEERPLGTGTGELPAEDATTEDARDQVAGAATRATVLDASGLSPRAISAATRLEAATVGDLLGLPSRDLFNLPGVGAGTRKELHKRIREWRARLDVPEAAPSSTADRRAARDEIASTHGPSARIGLDAIAAVLLPELTKNRSNLTEVEATRLLLGLPEAGQPTGLPLWPKQSEVARALQPKVSTGRVAQVLGRQRTRWRKDPAVRGVLDELVDMLSSRGRVAGVVELAEAILAQRGYWSTDPGLRRAVALAAVRAAVEIDPVDGEQRLVIRRHADRLMVALEVGEADGPDTPAGPALLDYAYALGKVADQLARREVLPTPAAVLRELRAVTVAGAPTDLEDRRLVLLAAAASANAAATARLEIYPRDLSPVRALRLAQAGVVPDGGSLSPDLVRERVQARFPVLEELPGHPRLGVLLRDAGFQLRWQHGGYVPPHVGSGSGSTQFRRRETRAKVSRWTADSPELAAALRTEERLRAAETGFRALTVQLSRLETARVGLARFGVVPCNVSAVFLGALREQLTPGAKPTWETILAADSAPPDSKAAFKLREYVEKAWNVARPRLEAEHEKANGPLLLYDAAPFARYDAVEVVNALASRAREGGPPLWLLCPMHDPGQPPRLDEALVPAQLPHEWIMLTDAWVANEHRSGGPGS